MRVVHDEIIVSVQTPFKGHAFATFFAIMESAFQVAVGVVLLQEKLRWRGIADN